MNNKLKAKKYFRRFTDYAGTLFLALFIVFIWQLYRSPMPLPFLKPYIIKALNHDDANYVVTVDNVDLELVRSIQPVKIIAKGIEYKKTNESIVIKAPRASVSFSIRALLRGIISPSFIKVEKPSILISFSYGGDKNSETKEVLNETKIAYHFNLFEDFMERFNSPDMSYPESYIDAIHINNADLEIYEKDYGRKLSFSGANYVFNRNQDNIEIGLDGNMKLESAAVPFDFSVKYYTKNKNINLLFSFDDLPPSSLADSFIVDGEDVNAYRVNIPISGKIDLDINFNEILANKHKLSRSLDTAITKFNFEFAGKDGNIIFSEDEKFNYDVSSFVLKGNVDSGLNRIEIKNADLNLDEKDTKLGLSINGLKDLILKGSPKNLSVVISAAISKLPLDELSKYWPRYIGEDAWVWVEEGIYDGSAENANFDFKFVYDNAKNNMRFSELSGSAEVSDATLNYLEGMPLVKNIYGKAYFYNDKIDIKIKKGMSNGNEVNGGHVILYDLDKYNNFIDVKLMAKSSVSDSLKLIDNPPFNYAKEMGVNPDNIEGDAETTLHLNFELKKDLEPEEVKINVVSNIKNVKIKNIIKNEIITSEEIKLNVTNKGIKVLGNVNLKDINMNLEWNRIFTPPYDNQYKISFLFNDEIKKKLGIEATFFNKPYFYGDAAVVAEINDIEGVVVADVRADIRDSEINYDLFGLNKPKGEVAKVGFKINMNNGKISSISDIILEKDNFEAVALATFDAKEKLKSVAVSSLRTGKTDVKAMISISNDKKPIKVNISGESYDLSHFFESKDEKPKNETERNSDISRLEAAPDMDVNVAVNNLWTNQKVPITNFAGSANFKKGIGVNQVKLVGNYSNDKEKYLKFEYLPHLKDEYMINVSSNDAGRTLKVLHIYGYMFGGNLDISMHKDKDDNISGHAKIRSFSIKNTGVMTRVLSLASLSGIIDMLKGDEIVFSHFDASFDYKNDKLSIREGKAFGNVVGITGQGYYDYASSYVNIKGDISPAYNVNRFLGNIPLLGRILSGKNETVFAARYKIKGKAESADIDINPLSVVSPSSVKDIFSSGKK